MDYALDNVYPVVGTFSSPAHAVTASLACHGRELDGFLLGPLLCSASQRARACLIDLPRRLRPPGPLSLSVKPLTGARRRTRMRA